MEAVRNTDSMALFNLEYLASRGQGAEPITSKPWVSTSYPPSEPPATNLTATSECLQLEWVYGYHAQVRLSSSPRSVRDVCSSVAVFYASGYGTVLLSSLSRIFKSCHLTSTCGPVSDPAGLAQQHHVQQSRGNHVASSKHRRADEATGEWPPSPALLPGAHR
jgi:hypothetical protein